jgi:hypothetical protein
MVTDFGVKKNEIGQVFLNAFDWSLYQQLPSWDGNDITTKVKEDL